MLQAPTPAIPTPAALLGGVWRGHDAQEPTLVTLGESTDRHWPVLPQLPDRGPGADALARSAQLMAELSIDLQPHGWRLSPPGTSPPRTARRAASLLDEDARRWADTAGAEGRRVEVLVLRLLGPLSLAAGLWLPRGERVLTDHAALVDVMAAYAHGVGEALPMLRKRTGAHRLALEIEEPHARAALTGTVATASGYRTARAVDRETARQAWSEFAVALAGSEPVRVWWHAEDPDSAALLPRPAQGDAPGLNTAHAPATDGTEPESARTGVARDLTSLEAPGGRAVWEMLAAQADTATPVLLTVPAGLTPEAVVRDAERADVAETGLAAWTLRGDDPVDARALRRLRAWSDEFRERAAQR
ncbi:MAG: hypothetical protein Q4G34_05020 [Micrococcus sp.]|nr:hypothetical protein [Micrococcus sp.]